MSSDPTTTDFIPPELEEIADLLPAYEILSFIAKGGMGAVYMARQKSLDRDVAIKVLPRHFGEDAEFRDAFETEAKSMAKLNHPNLIGIYDFGQIDGLLYIIMEMVQGKSLYHSAYDKTIDSMEAARITVEICNGLAHAHKNNILHRDIKPANILLDPSASAKIGDFGLARAVEDHESDSAFGTPGYTAPEVVHDPAAVDESTDLYSVGVILYQLLTSKLPDSNYVPAAKLVNCDFRFDQVIQKAINPSPNLRYRRAEDMAKAINQIIDSNSYSRPALLQAQSKTKPAPSGTRSLITAAPSPQNPTPNTGSNKQGSSPTPTSAPTTPPTSQIKVGSNTPFIRNLIIIVALLVSISIAWEGLKVVRAKRAAEKDRIAEINQQKDDDAAAEKNEKTAAIILAAHDKPKPLPTPPPKVETPRETLSRLKSQLITGSRNEMPKGTITQGGRARLAINEPMTWHQAREFCENHGGHLAILPETSDLQWLSDKLEPDQIIWLGAGSAGNEEWRWIDGTPWKQEIRSTSKASYVCVNDTGILDPQPAHTKHSFFIEWNMTGSTPASLENQLRRCAASLLENQPLFPAGTISYDNRHYLLVEHNTVWQTARELATLAGGTLATPSNPDENAWMLDFAASSLQNDQACWIGGIRKLNSSWEWATGESWAFAKWGKGLPDEKAPSACAIMPSQIWDDYPLDTSLPCFLIEWSKDSQNHEANGNGGKTKPNILAPARKTAIKRIQTIQKKYEAQFSVNIKRYEQELNSYKRRLPKSLQQTYSPTIRAMQNRYVNNRIPENLPRHSMPGKLAKILDSGLRIQNQKEAQFLSEIDNLRARYRKNLSTLAKDFQDKGLTSLQRDVQKEINDTSKGGHKFIKHISNSLR